MTRDNAAALDSHDVVDVELENTTVRGVYRRTTQGRNEPVAKITIPRTHDAEIGEQLNGDAYVDDTEIVVTLEHVEHVGTPDVSGIDSRNYSVDRHVELLERQDLVDDTDDVDRGDGVATDGGYSPVQLGTVVFELEGGRYRRRDVVDVVYRSDEHDGPRALLEAADGSTIAVDAIALEEQLADETVDRWVPSMVDSDDEWIPHPRRAADEPAAVDVDDDDRLERFDAPRSPKELVVERNSGEGSQTEVNAFLEGGPDGLVSHELGSVSSWKTSFVARHPETGEIVSAVVLHYYNPSQTGVELAITRLANHPAAPHNTSSYMISRVRKWAERTGHDRLVTYSGVDENEGVCYRAAGLEPVGEPERVEGKNWSGDTEEWVRQKWAYELSPDDYAEWGEQRATESVTTAAAAC